MSNAIMPDDVEVAILLGTNIARVRTERHLTQQDVATFLDLPLDLYRQMEHGTAVPALPAFLRLSLFLDVSTDELLGIDPPSEPLPGPGVRLTPEHADEFRLLQRRLRAASPKALHLVSRFLTELTLFLSTRDSSYPTESE